MMDWSFQPLSESLKVFKARMDLYIEDLNITNTNKQATKIKIASGDEGMRRILNSGMSDADQKIPEKIWELLEAEVDLSVKISFRVHRLEFSNIRQQNEETTQQYLSRLREKASKCNFEPDELNERLIEMVILSTPHEDFRKELLIKPKGHQISEVLERGREYEAILASQTSLKSMQSPLAQSFGEQNVHKVDAMSNIKRNKCRNCGLSHPPRSCPAYFDKCNGCGNKGHWVKFCRKANSGRQAYGQHNTTADKPKHYHEPRFRHNTTRKTHSNNHEINFDQGDQEDESATVFYSIAMAGIDHKTCKSEAFITLDVDHSELDAKKPLLLKVDTGAGGNTLPLRTYNQMFKNAPSNKRLQPEPYVKLTSYSGDEISCFGSIKLGIKKERDEKFSYEKFYVVNVNSPAIIGLPSCQKLDIVTLNLDSLRPAATLMPTTEKPKPYIKTTQQLQEAYPDQFDRVGEFNVPAKLYLKEDAVPSCDAPRKVSVHLRPKIKAELQKMEQDGIIRKLDVNEHSDWCSSLVYVTKTDGSLRCCLDPKKLNQNLKRAPHKIPTLEEINPIFSGATVFSKLDAKAGYWSVHLHEDSQLLTTFRTPFGRYCWKRLPFGLNVSQDIFQARMDMIVEGLEGVANIADDVGIAGTDDKDHNNKLIQFMNRAQVSGLCFNSKKCNIATSEISFFGNIYSKDGLRPDPTKVKDLQNMPSPTSKEDLQRFLGLMTYLSPYIPNFSSKCESLRRLLKSDSAFLWEADHERCFQELKKTITEDSVLAFYDQAAPLTLEVDSSTKGLGVALTQRNKPIAFASKTLTHTQANYSNIEREALALVHGIQRFHTYLYGKRFTALTDHKPLESIWRKPLTRAPPRLQRLFLQLQGYDMDLQYKPGPDMVLSDTLSRLPSSKNHGTIPLDERVDGIILDDLDLEVKPITLLNFTPDRLSTIRKETSEDPELRLLMQMIIDGWPDDIKQCTPEIRHFFSYRESLAMENGVIFKGRQVLIPEASRKDILKQLHTSHQGIKKTQLLARESVFWENINKDIEEMTKTCNICQKYQPNQRAEPTLHHSIPPAPWWKVGSDIFHINNKNFLIIADYFSKYPIVAEIGGLSSSNIIKAFKSTCALFGAPKEIVSDNGPQFSGSEFKKFVNDWGIKHITSSPYYPKSNGFAERTIQTVKNMIRKCTETNTDISEALLHLRATPIDSMTKSPAELMFGRPMTTANPSRSEPLYHHVETRNHLVDRLQNATGKILPTLLPGQNIRILDQPTKTWMPGSVIQKAHEPRSYLVETESGQQLRRNRHQLRTTASHQSNQIQTMPANTPVNEPSDHPEQHHIKPTTACSDSTPNHNQHNGSLPKFTKSGRKVVQPTRYRLTTDCVKYSGNLG